MHEPTTDTLTFMISDNFQVLEIQELTNVYIYI